MHVICAALNCGDRVDHAEAAILMTVPIKPHLLALLFNDAFNKTYDRSRAIWRRVSNGVAYTHRARAAAVIKSYRKGDRHLADLVYSGVPAGLFGLEQVIEIGPMSGKSNVIYWLEKRGIEPSEERVNRVYEHAKQASAVLEEKEIMQLV